MSSLVSSSSSASASSMPPLSNGDGCSDDFIMIDVNGDGNGGRHSDGNGNNIISNNDNRSSEMKEKEEIAAAPSAVSDAAYFDREQPAVTASIRSLATPSRALLSSDVLLTSPAAFLRELTENAFDSGATNILITITYDSTSGVIDSIEIRDNGIGIARSEKHLIALAHCTSKLRTFEDTPNVRSFGFRGEALYCIAGSVTSMVVQSRRASDTIAWRATWTEGKRGEDGTIAQASSGTMVKISGIYHNRPVRLLHAKKEAPTEKLKIQELLLSYAYVYPQVRIVCNVPQFAKIALPLNSATQLAGIPLFRQSIPPVLASTANTQQLLEFAHTSADEFRVEGFITRHDADAHNKELFRAKADRIFFYISRTRSIILPWLSKAVIAEWRLLSASHLHRLHMRQKGDDPSAIDAAAADTQSTNAFAGKFPLTLLHITIPTPERLLDLNRSPDKRDILIGDEEVFKTTILASMKQGLKEAFEAIDKKEHEEFMKKKQQQAIGMVNQNGATNIAATAAPTGVTTSVSSAMIDDADVEFIPTPPAFKQSQPSTPTSSAATATSNSPRTDYSSFAQPLAQPQHFNSPPKSNAAAAAVTAAASTNNIAQSRSPAAASSSSVPIPRASPPVTPKRPRADLAQTSPMRQTQLSLIDTVNVAPSFAPRMIPMDDTMLHQLADGFLRTQSAIVDQVPSTPKYIASFMNNGICILNIPPDADDHAATLPTLTAFSTLRADEACTFYSLLAAYEVPHVPLDEPIVIQPDESGLDENEVARIHDDIVHSSQLQLEQSVPPDCITFQKALQLCGFELVAESSPVNAVRLTSVPSDSTINMDDFVASLRAIWSDVCFQRTSLLRVKAASPADPHSISSNMVRSYQPNTSWRVAGVRRCVLQHAATIALSRHNLHCANTANSHHAAVGSPYSISAIKLAARLEAISNADDEPIDFAQLTCPHDHCISYRITNRQKKELGVKTNSM